MPATETTWRDLKLMHVVFGVSSVVLLLSTVWMLADDHSRSWKDYQRKYRDIDVWTAAARVDEQDTAEYDLTAGQLQQQLEAIQAEALSGKGRKLFQEFVEKAQGTSDSPAPEEDIEAANFIAEDVEKLAGYTDAKECRDLRMDLYNRMRDLIGRVRFREDVAARNLKFKRAELDKALADYSLAVGEGTLAERTAALQLQVDRVRSDVTGLTKVVEDEQTHRKDLEEIFKQLTAEQDEAQKALDDHQKTLALLRKAHQERGNPGKQTLELPILDAFNSPLKINQIWLPDLTLNNNFRDVARFDRCMTCHQGIDKTQPGSATQPAYAEAHHVTLSLPTPPKPPEPEKDEQGTVLPLEAYDIERVYGMRLAQRGLLKHDEVTVSAVYPHTFAAQAGLMSGDTIVRINDAAVLNLNTVLNYLLHNARWGQPLSLTVRRGLPHPYSSHPRLDLYVGSLSPHPAGTFGCTICHQGQGSATSFEWASHTPSSPRQGVQWSREYGWFNNHHWIFPMLPEPFAQASCVKCHHEVVDLEPSAKFPDPPAPKLVKGYELVREYGCFGCHEVNGYAGPGQRVGPDLRTEPAFFAAAQQIKADSGFDKLADEVKDWIERLIAHPEDDDVRRRLREFVLADAEADQPTLAPGSHALEGVLKDLETPGTFRKVGPSLRHVASKVGFEWLYSWVRNPRDFRPSTKMPRFFGLWNHLVPAEKLDEYGQPINEHDHPAYEESQGLIDAKKFEPIEVRAISSYLLKSSQPFEYLKPFSGITAEPSAQRGKKVFETRGCLACHQHESFPQAKATQGPDLSRIGAKLDLEPFGAKWLYSWVREPNRYHARTVMPNVMLEPITQGDGKVSDPAADATAFLMQSTEDWKPSDVPAQSQWTESERKALYELALLHLKDKFPTTRAEEYLKDGIPATRAIGLKGDEVALVREGDSTTPEEQTERMLLYVGRRTISKYGCAGCHDIPGYEDAKPVGTALADWGRKDPSRLAFEQVSQYITHHAWPGKKTKGGAGDSNSGNGADSLGAGPGSLAHGSSIAHANLQFEIEQLQPTEGWLMEKLLGHEREGFLWQKLREPRSYDFKKTENKGYNERLRMPQFPFDQEEIEAVMTFVLGLVAEPPAPQYIASYANRPREQAVIEGIKVVEKYNCGGCHQLDFDTWDIAFKSGELGAAIQPSDYPFLLPHFTPEEIKASTEQDHRGILHARLVGAPLVDAKGQVVTTDENEQGELFEGGGLGVRFVLWKDVLLDGKPWLVGGKNPLVPENRVTAKYPGRGGDLGRWIYPVVVADELKLNPNAKPEEAWGWLPPPLVDEGRKVQTQWLHDFLLEPYKIRPATVLRMPKFNMSSAEATALVDYFAARDDVPSPYEFDARTSSDYLSEAQLSHPTRLVDALKIVTDNNYCVKCHLIGDFTPPGSVTALAPQLDETHRRLRPDFVQQWVANPKRTLPYTGMPVNIPYGKPVSQKLFPGDATQQLDGVVDLLMNWARFTKEQFTLKPWIKPAAGATNANATTNAN